MPREIRDSLFRQGGMRRDSEFFTVGVGDSQRAAYWEGGEGGPLNVAAIGNKQTEASQGK